MAFKLRRPPSLDAKLDSFPYQIDAVRAIQSLSYAAIFHEQGLGKTKIAIDLALTWLAEDIVDSIFFITKKSLVHNWLCELELHSHVTPRVLAGNAGQNSNALNSPVLIYIMNYEVISRNLELIRLFQNTCRVGAVLDESQKIKNPISKLSLCFHSISEGFDKRLIMTGTPVANRPYDIWSQVKFLDQGKALGDNFDEFKADLDLPSRKDSSHEYGRQLAGILEKIKHFAVRETKQTAGIELPEKTILTHRVLMAPRQLEIYNAYRDELSYQFWGEDGPIIDDVELVLKRLLRLVQCASNPTMLDDSYTETPAKYSKLLELLSEIEVSSNKIIVWTGFVKNVEWLNGMLDGFFPQKVHGLMPVEVRNESIRIFKNEDSCRLLLATPGSAKEGLTLTVANHAIFYDRSFSLDDYIQAQDRIHRISQETECYVHNLIAMDTVDEWVDTLLNAKFLAAQMAQGDITAREFETSFDFDLSQALTQILARKEKSFKNYG